MPIHVRISHHDRLVVAVAHGTITGEEFLNAVRESVEQGALHYRKIIDVAAANTDADMERLKQLLVLARNSPQAAQRGPLAFVVDRNRGDLVRELAALTEEGERPIRVFTNLHEARKWLDEIFKVELKR
jgi:predicted ATPase